MNSQPLTGGPISAAPAADKRAKQHGRMRQQVQMPGDGALEATILLIRTPKIGTTHQRANESTAVTEQRDMVVQCPARMIWIGLVRGNSSSAVRIGMRRWGSEDPPTGTPTRIVAADSEQVSPRRPLCQFAPTLATDTQKSVFSAGLVDCHSSIL